MSDQSINKLKVIKDSIKNFTSESKPNIICVSKTFPLIALEALIKSGHYHYGENKVQEAEDKWSEKLNKKQKQQVLKTEQFRPTKQKQVWNIVSL